MKILLDENLPRKLGARLTGHEVSTVRREGWAGISNGKLLALAEHRFEVMLTMDFGIPHQQVLPRFNIAVVLLRAKTNTLEDLLPLVPEILAKLPMAQKGALTQVG